MDVTTINWPWNKWLRVNFRAEIELQNEAKSHVLNHVNIVKLYAVVFEPNNYGVVLEYVPNGGLDVFIVLNRVSWLCYILYNCLYCKLILVLHNNRQTSSWSIAWHSNKLEVIFRCISSMTHHHQVFTGRLVCLVSAANNLWCQSVSSSQHLDYKLTDSSPNNFLWSEFLCTSNYFLANSLQFCLTVPRLNHRLRGCAPLL